MSTQMVESLADRKLAVALAESVRTQNDEEGQLIQGDDRRLATLAERIFDKQMQGAAVFLEICECVNEAHQLLSGVGRDGFFRPWVKSQCHFSVRSAYRFLDVHRRFAGLKRATLAHFERAALYCLAREDCPREAVGQAIEMADRGEQITRATATGLIANLSRADAPDLQADVVAEDSPAESGPDLDDLVDAFNTYVLPRVDSATPKVRKDFGAWLADEAAKLRIE